MCTKMTGKNASDIPQHTAKCHLELQRIELTRQMVVYRWNFWKVQPNTHIEPNVRNGERKKKGCTYFECNVLYTQCRFSYFEQSCSVEYRIGWMCKSKSPRFGFHWNKYFSYTIINSYLANYMVCGLSLWMSSKWKRLEKRWRQIGE